MYEYKSIFKERILSMVDLKVSLGYKAHSYVALQDFDRFCSTKYPLQTELTKGLVLEWGAKRQAEKINNLKTRLNTIRQFGLYLNSKGIPAYVIPFELIGEYEHFEPYLFTEEELRSFFETIDSIKPSKRSPLREYTLPAAFRFLYCCGVRPNEICGLRREDVDFDSKTVFILNSKGKKDRVFGISGELAGLLQMYDAVVEKRCPGRAFFFAMNAKEDYRVPWLGRQHRHCWRKTGVKDESKTPRVYDWRHNYPVRILMEWLDKGEDIMSLLPFLSAYMGHANFSSTAYYIHLIPDRLVQCKGIDWDRLESLIPEVNLQNE